MFFGSPGGDDTQDEASRVSPRSSNSSRLGDSGERDQRFLSREDGTTPVASMEVEDEVTLPVVGDNQHSEMDNYSHPETKKSLPSPARIPSPQQLEQSQPQSEQISPSIEPEYDDDEVYPPGETPLIVKRKRGRPPKPSNGRNIPPTPASAVKPPAKKGKLSVKSVVVESDWQCGDGIDGSIDGSVTNLDDAMMQGSARKRSRRITIDPTLPVDGSALPSSTSMTEDIAAFTFATNSQPPTPSAGTPSHAAYGAIAPFSRTNSMSLPTPSSLPGPATFSRSMSYMRRSQRGKHFDTQRDLVILMPDTDPRLALDIRGDAEWEQFLLAMNEDNSGDWSDNDNDHSHGGGGGHGGHGLGQGHGSASRHKLSRKTQQRESTLSAPSSSGSHSDKAKSSSGSTAITEVFTPKVVECLDTSLLTKRASEIGRCNGSEKLSSSSSKKKVFTFDSLTSSSVPSSSSSGVVACVSAETHQLLSSLPEMRIRGGYSMIPSSTLLAPYESENYDESYMMYDADSEDEDFLEELLIDLSGPGSVKEEVLSNGRLRTSQSNPLRQVVNNYLMELMFVRLEKELELVKCFTRPFKEVMKQHSYLSQTLMPSCESIIQESIRYCRRLQKRRSKSEADDVKEENDNGDEKEEDTEDGDEDSPLKKIIAVEDRLTESALRSRQQALLHEQGDAFSPGLNDPTDNAPGAPLVPPSMGPHILKCRYEDLSKFSVDQLKKLVPEESAISTLVDLLEDFLSKIPPPPSAASYTSTSSLLSTYSSNIQSIYMTGPSNVSRTHATILAQQPVQPVPQPLSLNISQKTKICHSIYFHWIEKRSQCKQSLLRAYHRFMMHLWNRPESVEVPMNGDYTTDSLISSYLQLNRIRKDLDRGRLIIDRVRRREKLKKDIVKCAADQLDMDVLVHLKIAAKHTAKAQMNSSTSSLTSLAQSQVPVIIGTPGAIPRKRGRPRRDQTQGSNQASPPLPLSTVAGASGVKNANGQTRDKFGKFLKKSAVPPSSRSNQSSLTSPLGANSTVATGGDTPRSADSSHFSAPTASLAHEHGVPSHLDHRESAPIIFGLLSDPIEDEEEEDTGTTIGIAIKEESQTPSRGRGRPSLASIAAAQAAAAAIPVPTAREQRAALRASKAPPVPIPVVPISVAKTPSSNKKSPAPLVVKEEPVQDANSESESDSEDENWRNWVADLLAPLPSTRPPPPVPAVVTAPSVSSGLSSPSVAGSQFHSQTSVVMPTGDISLSLPPQLSATSTAYTEPVVTTPPPEASNTTAPLSVSKTTAANSLYGTTSFNDLGLVSVTNSIYFNPAALNPNTINAANTSSMASVSAPSIGTVSVAQIPTNSVMDAGLVYGGNVSVTNGSMNQMSQSHSQAYPSTSTGTSYYSQQTMQSSHQQYLAFSPDRNDNHHDSMVMLEDPPSTETNIDASDVMQIVEILAASDDEDGGDGRSHLGFTDDYSRSGLNSGGESYHMYNSGDGGQYYSDQHYGYGYGGSSDQMMMQSHSTQSQYVVPPTQYIQPSQQQMYYNDSMQSSVPHMNAVSVNTVMPSTMSHIAAEPVVQSQSVNVSAPSTNAATSDAPIAVPTSGPSNEDDIDLLELDYSTLYFEGLNKLFHPPAQAASSSASGAGTTMNSHVPLTSVASSSSINTGLVAAANPIGAAPVAIENHAQNACQRQGLSINTNFVTDSSTAPPSLPSIVTPSSASAHHIVPHPITPSSSTPGGERTGRSSRSNSKPRNTVSTSTTTSSVSLRSSSRNRG